MDFILPHSRVSYVLENSYWSVLRSDKWFISPLWRCRPFRSPSISSCCTIACNLSCILFCLEDSALALHVVLHSWKDRHECCVYCWGIFWYCYSMDYSVLWHCFMSGLFPFLIFTSWPEVSGYVFFSSKMENEIQLAQFQILCYYPICS